MTDQELIEKLRLGFANPIVAADRIEDLLKFSSYWHNRAEALEAKLAKAVEYFKKLDRRGDALEKFDPVVHEIVTAALAELEGK